MKINRLHLIDSLAKIAPVIVKSSHNPVLSCVLIQIANGKMILRGTDLGVTVVDSFAVDGDLQIDMCIDFASISDWINNTYEMDNNWIDATKKGDKLCLRYANSSINLISKGNSQDFPMINELQNTTSIASANGNELGDTIRRTLRVINPKNIEGNLLLQSGLFVFADGEIAITASDGVSLAYNRVNADVKTQCEISTSHKTMGVVDGMLRGAIVQVKRCGGHILFESGNTKVFATLTENKFPIKAVQEMIAAKHANKAQVAGGAISMALSAYRGLIEQDSTRRKGIFIRLLPETGQIAIQPEETIGGDGERIVNAKWVEGNEVSFIANYHAWGNCIRAIDGIDIIIHYEDKQWVHLTSTNGKQRYVIAPLMAR